MKKRRLLSIAMTIILLITSSPMVFADDDRLDIEKVAIKVIQNSAQLKQANNSLNMVSKIYHEMNNATSKLKQILYIPDFFAARLGLMSKYEVSKNLTLLPMKARTMLDQTSNQVAAGQNSAKAKAYEGYIQLIKAKTALDMQQKLVKNMEFNYNKSQTKLKNGTISKSDAQLAEISYKKELLVLKTYQRNFETAIINLNKAMGQPLSKRYSEYIEDNIKPSENIKPLKDYISDALERRSEILNAKMDLEYMKKDQEYEKVYHPVETDVYYDLSKYNLNEAQNKLDNAEIDVQIKLSSAYKELESKMKNWEYWKTQCDYALQGYDIKNKLYKQGLATEYDLMNADLTLTQAKLQLRFAELDAWLYQVKMDLASDIGPGI